MSDNQSIILLKIICFIQCGILNLIYAKLTEVINICYLANQKASTCHNVFITNYLNL